MSSNLHERIRQIREERGLKQAEVALKIGLSRLTYINIESGEKNPTIDQLFEICQALSIKPQQLLFPEEQAPPRTSALTRYRQMCLACIAYGSNPDDRKITKTKLAKLLYLIDFSWFRKTGHSMSGLQYYHLPHGPVAEEFFRMIDGMFESGQILVEAKGAAMLISANETTFSNDLDNAEIAHIKDVCTKWQNADTMTIVEFTHTQAPWSMTQPGTQVPYELAKHIPDDHLY